MTNAQTCILLGCDYPYHGSGDEKYYGNDPAMRAALGVLYDLRDRSGIGNALDGIDDDIRLEITQKMANIIKAAYCGY